MGGPASENGPGSGCHRRGNGVGWGGPAKGAGTSKWAALDGKAGRLIRAGMSKEQKAAKAEKVERKEASRAEMLDFYVDVKRDIGEPMPLRMAAAEKWLDRTDGKPAQTTINTGPNGGPMTTEVVYRWAEPEK